MKIIITLFFQIIAYAGSIVSCIWAIVEFLLYLVKDREFNWWSVWSILICIGLGIILFILNIVFVITKKEEKINPLERKSYKSRLQQRLDQKIEESKKST